MSTENTLGAREISQEPAYVTVLTWNSYPSPVHPHGPPGRHHLFQKGTGTAHHLKVWHRVSAGSDFPHGWRHSSPQFSLCIPPSAPQPSGPRPHTRGLRGNSGIGPTSPPCSERQFEVTGDKLILCFPRLGQGWAGKVQSPLRKLLNTPDREQEMNQHGEVTLQHGLLM